MKNRISQLASGHLYYRTPVLKFSDEMLSAFVRPGKLTTFRMEVRTENRVPGSLYFYSDSLRVRVPEKLTVTNTSSFSLEINTEGLEVGEILKGEIGVLYNGGRITLPYLFTVSVLLSSGTNLVFKRARDFSNFVSENPEEGRRIFAMQEFFELPFMKNRKMRALHKIYFSPLRRTKGIYEFLRAAGCPIEKAPETPPDPLAEEKEKNNVKTDFRIRWHLELLFRQYLLLGEDPSEEALTLIRTELLRIVNKNPEHCLPRLFSAYFDYRNGDLLSAKKTLFSVQDRIQKNRLLKKDEYTLFAVLAALLSGDEEKIRNVAALTHKYYMEGQDSALLFYLEYKLNEDYKENPKRGYLYLCRLYERGSRSGLFYSEMASYFRDDVSFEGILDDFMLHSLMFALRHSLISEKKLFEILSFDADENMSMALYLSVLKLGYQKFKNRELLQKILRYFIQKKKTGRQYFGWYQEGVDRDLTMDGLYESYLSSMPEEKKGALPKNLVSYFGYGKEISSVPLDLLYRNILLSYKNDPIMMDLYMDKITAFAMKRMTENRYSMSMEKIFPVIMERKYLTPENAEAMFRLYLLYRIETEKEQYRRVLVYYPEISKEMSFSLEAGKALVPLFSDEALIYFEDDRGRHFPDPNMKKTKVYKDDELRNQCVLYMKETTLTSLADADTILKKHISSPVEADFLKRFLEDPDMDIYYISSILEELLSDSATCDRGEDFSDFIFATDFNSFTQKGKEGVIRYLVSKGHPDRAYQYLRKYGIECANTETLSDFATVLTEDPEKADDELVLEIARRLYRENKADHGVLRYLSHYLTGTVMEMFSVFQTCRKEKVLLHHLPERILLAATFSQDTKNCDPVFESYMSMPGFDETVRDGMLVLRSHESFLREKKMPEYMIRLLKARVFALPKIAHMALLQVYSERLKKLSEEDRPIIEKLLLEMASDAETLSFIRNFDSQFVLPSELRGRSTIEYRDPDAAAVSVIGQIFPGRHYFHRTLQEVYPSVFVRSFILYPDEWIKFTYVITKKDGTKTEQEGEIVTRAQEKNQRKGLFEDLLLLEKKAEERPVKESAELLRKVILRDRLSDMIFKDEQDG